VPEEPEESILIELYSIAINFYDKLRGLSSNPASILYSLFGNEERLIIFDKYILTRTDK